MGEPVRINQPEIDIIFCDVDGVMTDGGMYWGENGLMCKKFNTRDAMGLHRLTDAGIRVIFLTGSSDELSEDRLRHIGAKEIYRGVINKGDWMNSFIEAKSLEPEKLLYIGDDYNDIPAMVQCGMIVCPADSVAGVMEIADLVIGKNGGQGILSVLADLILFQSH